MVVITEPDIQIVFCYERQQYLHLTADFRHCPWHQTLNKSTATRDVRPPTKYDNWIVYGYAAKVLDTRHDRLLNWLIDNDSLLTYTKDDGLKLDMCWCQWMKHWWLTDSTFCNLHEIQMTWRLRIVESLLTFTEWPLCLNLLDTNGATTGNMTD